MLGCCTAVAPHAAAQPAAIRRLDGSTISPGAVDATVTRLMNAAEVTGVAIAIFNDHKIAYLREGDKLFVQENDETKQELGAESDGRFFSKSPDDEYSFELDSAGQVTAMYLRADGKDFHMPREK